MRKIFTERKQKGEFYTLVQDLKLFESEYFFKQFRMTPRKLEELLGWVAPRILKSNVKREAISPEERLCVTLRYVVTGDAHVTIVASYRISPTSISRIIKETTKVIWNVPLDKGFLEAPILRKNGKKSRNHLKASGISRTALVPLMANTLLCKLQLKVVSFFTIIRSCLVLFC